MNTGRRQLLQSGLAAVTTAAAKSASQGLGIPGLYPGKVIAVELAGCLVSGKYQPQAVRQMIERGMTEFTGAPARPDAWRSMFTKGDVVAIKLSPVGGRTLCSDASVLRRHFGRS